jgi:hypothetical protein
MHENVSRFSTIVLPRPGELWYAVAEVQLVTVHAVRTSRVSRGCESHTQADNSLESGEAQLEHGFECRQESPARHSRAIPCSGEFIHPHFPRRHEKFGDGDQRVVPMSSNHSPPNLIPAELRAPSKAIPIPSKARRGKAGIIALKSGQCQSVDLGACMARERREAQKGLVACTARVASSSTAKGATGGRRSGDTSGGGEDNSRRGSRNALNIVGGEGDDRDSGIGGIGGSSGAVNVDDDASEGSGAINRSANRNHVCPITDRCTNHSARPISPSA